MKILFSEIYSVYFDTVACIIDEAIVNPMNEKRILEIIEEKAFSETMLSLLPSIKNEEWLIINKNFETPIKKSPQMPLSTLQKRWLKSILQDPRIFLFDVDDSGLEEVVPLFKLDDFVYFDRYLDGDNYQDPQYISSFRCILKAFKEKRHLKIEYQSRRDHLVIGEFIPLKLEYSSKDDKFRLLAKEGGSFFHINLARIMKCSLGDNYNDDKFKNIYFRESFICFILKDERDALNRVMTHFSDFKKETSRIDDIAYEVTLWYKSEDKTELLIRVLSFGPMIKVIEPIDFIDLIKERLRMQKSLLEKYTK